MKTKQKLNHLLWSLIFIFGTLAFFSCEENMVEDDLNSIDEITLMESDEFDGIGLKTVAHDIDYCGEVETNILFAARHIDAGIVEVGNDEEFLYVTIATKDGWFLKHSHLYVGLLENAPLSKPGNPQIGIFPYQTAHMPYVTSYTYRLPIGLMEDCFIVAVHAEVIKKNEKGEIIMEETAWGDGELFTNRGSWAMYSNYCLQECFPCEIEPVVKKIYLFKNIHKGKLSIINDDTYLHITYYTYSNTFMETTHLYVGELDGIPVDENNNPIPDQFLYIVDHDPLTQQYEYKIPLEGLPECYVIAAHATVNKVIDGVVEDTTIAWAYGEEFPGADQWGWYIPYCSQSCD